MVELLGVLKQPLVQIVGIRRKMRVAMAIRTARDAVPYPVPLLDTEDVMDIKKSDVIARCEAILALASFRPAYAVRPQ